MNVKLKITALLAAILPLGAMADSAQANFTSNVASYCTIGQSTPGVMHVNETSVSTDTPAIMMVNTNEGGVYKVGVTDPGDFSSKPAGFAGIATIAASYNVTGANTIGATGSATQSNLDNVGSNSMSVSINGTIDSAAVAGDYAAVSIASCVAQ